MLGLMQDWPLLLHRIIDHAAIYHGERKVITRSVEGPIVETNYAAIRARALKVAKRLEKDGIKSGDRVATLAWNTWRHMECWYGILGIGAIYHTVNPRLFPEQIVWIDKRVQDVDMQRQQVISTDQRRPLPNANWTATIQHGLPPNLFRPSYEQGSYLAFLGRLAAEKGPEDAIRIARVVRKPLRIAAKIPRGETAYFKKRLEPLIDGKNVQLVGEVDDLRIEEDERRLHCREFREDRRHHGRH